MNKNASTKNVERTTKSTKSKRRTKHAVDILMSMEVVEEMTKIEMFHYVERLHKLIHKQMSKLKQYKEMKKKIKYRDKVKTGLTQVKRSKLWAALQAMETANTKSKESDDSVQSRRTYTTIKGGDAAQPSDQRGGSGGGRGDDGGGGKDSATASSSQSKSNPTTSLVDEIKEAAESASQELGFVYEPTSGLYYDCKTGYYYNAEHGLYYDGNTGTYYTYNQDEKQFEFYSQAYVDEPPTSQQQSNNPTSNQTDDNFTTHTATATKHTEITRHRHRSRSHSRRRPCSPRLPRRHRHRRRISVDTNGIKNEREDGELSSNNDDVDDDDDDIDDNDDYYENDDYHDINDDNIDKNNENYYYYYHYNDVDDVIDDNNQDQNSYENGYYDKYAYDDCEDKIGTSLSHNIEAYEDVAKKYPPCLRMIVVKTNLPKLKFGELFIITYKGGTLGREGTHDVIISDLNVSKFHLKFNYNETNNHYECIDLGSRNGTFLNGRRMSTAKQESEPHQIEHGTIIELCQTKLLCHIHEGLATCEECEPGLVQSAAAAEIDGAVNSSAVIIGAPVPATITYVSNELDALHKAETKRLKKRYGLADQKYLIQQQVQNDRAAKRRKEVGSTAPNEKTAVSTIDTAICTENKGFKLLAKLGWNQGQGLGKNQSGIVDPIALVSNDGTKGLGCDESIPKSIPIDRKTVQKTRQLQITQERYNTVKASHELFTTVTDDSD